MRILLIYISLIILSCLVFSCSNRDAEIRQTYRIAGRNKHELEKVLRHYEKMEDSIKLAAADFLIRNMDIQIHYHDRLTDITIDTLLNHREEPNDMLPVIKASVWKQSKKLWPWLNRSRRIYDAAEIDADVLISHIDHAVNEWKNSPYAAHIDFNQFCELILPYKSNNSKPEDWIRLYEEKYSWLKDTLDVLRHPPFATSIFHSEINRSHKWGNLDLERDLTLLEMSRFKIADCRQVSVWESSVYRSIGLPTGRFYTPRWASHHQGHYWTAYLDQYGEWRCAQGYMADQSNFMCHEKKMSKVFMWTYGKQPSSFRAYAIRHGIPEKDIPPYLKPYNMVDLTDRFLPVTDLTIQLNRKGPPRAKSVFLCTFNKPWQAIHWAPLTGDTVTFTDMGRDLLYLPAYFHNGRYIQAGDPFILTLEGEINPVILNKKQTIDIKLSRKFPIREYPMYSYSQPMINSVFELASDSLFIDIGFKKVITAPIQTDFDFTTENRDRLEYEMFWQSITVDTARVYQYLRYRSSPPIKCLIGEIEVFDDLGNKLQATYSGSGPNPQYIADGVPGENYRDDSTGGWVIMDFKKPVKISRIRYIVAEDYNAVQIGQEYELFYWGGEWISLGKQIAEEKVLTFTAPANAVYYFKCNTQGREERIFTYNVKPIWW
jgi:hypothetical protein